MGIRAFRHLLSNGRLHGYNLGSNPYSSYHFGYHSGDLFTYPLRRDLFSRLVNAVNFPDTGEAFDGALVYASMSREDEVAAQALDLNIDNEEEMRAIKALIGTSHLDELDPAVLAILTAKHSVEDLRRIQYMAGELSQDRGFVIAFNETILDPRHQVQFSPGDDGGDIVVRFPDDKGVPFYVISAISAFGQEEEQLLESLREQFGIISR